MKCENLFVTWYVLNSMAILRFTNHAFGVIGCPLKSRFAVLALFRVYFEPVRLNNSSHIKQPYKPINIIAPLKALCVESLITYKCIVFKRGRSQYHIQPFLLPQMEQKGLNMSVIINVAAEWAAPSVNRFNYRLRTIKYSWRKRFEQSLMASTDQKLGCFLEFMSSSDECMRFTALQYTRHEIFALETRRSQAWYQKFLEISLFHVAPLGLEQRCLLLTKQIRWLFSEI